MLSLEDSREALSRFFRQQRVADVATLCKLLKTSTRMGVFRRLSLVGYLTSYSHGGRYYTLTDVPDFDSDGLWQCQGVYFSRHRTLKETVGQLVQTSAAGRTHQELQSLLRVRIHNALLDLVRLGRIAREVMEALYLYVSADHQIAADQVARRKELLQDELPVARVGAMSPALVIEVLLEVIHGARVVPDPDVIRTRLAARSVIVALEQVNDIFHTYGLKKTVSSPPLRARR